MQLLGLLFASKTHVAQEAFMKKIRERLIDLSVDGLNPLLCELCGEPELKVIQAGRDLRNM